MSDERRVRRRRTQHEREELRAPKRGAFREVGGEVEADAVGDAFVQTVGSWLWSVSNSPGSAAVSRLATRPTHVARLSASAINVRNVSDRRRARGAGGSTGMSNLAKRRCPLMSLRRPAMR